MLSNQDYFDDALKNTLSLQLKPIIVFIHSNIVYLSCIFKFIEKNLKKKGDKLFILSNCDSFIEKKMEKKSRLQIVFNVI